MNVTPISGTNNITPVDNNNNFELIINNTTANAPNNTHWLTQEAFMLDVINTFQNFGFNLIDNLGVNATTNNADALLSTNITLSEALNNFVLSLQAALNQASTTNQTGTTNTTEQGANADQTGFNNFATDLFLLSLLNNNGLTGTNNITSNPLLQSNFDTLLNVLLPLSPGVTTSPNLNDFFNMMLNNLQILINNQNNVGTSISTTI